MNIGNPFETPPPMDLRIASTIARMQQELEEPLSIDALAHAMNLSASQFTHLFTRETGLSPAQYLHVLRLQRARALLERTFLPVKHVMARVGINDSRRFARDFRRYHGVSPTGLRKSSWATPQVRSAWQDRPM